MRLSLRLSALVVANTAIVLHAAGQSYQATVTKEHLIKTAAINGGHRRFPEEWNAPTMTSAAKVSPTTIQTLKTMAAAA